MFTRMMLKSSRSSIATINSVRKSLKIAKLTRSTTLWRSQTSFPSLTTPRRSPNATNRKHLTRWNSNSKSRSGPLKTKQQWWKMRSQTVSRKLTGRPSSLVSCPVSAASRRCFARMPLLRVAPRCFSETPSALRFITNSSSRRKVSAINWRKKLLTASASLRPSSKQMTQSIKNIRSSSSGDCGKSGRSKKLEFKRCNCWGFWRNMNRT